MQRYEIMLPFLDECGSVYLPAMDLSGNAVRLNPQASSLWRQISQYGAIEASSGSAAATFVDWLVGRHAIKPI